MKVSNNSVPHSKNSQIQKRSPKQQKGITPDVKVNIRKMDKLKVAANNPSDPTTASKVLDGLHSGMIDFTQEQRDAIAKILGSRAEASVEKTEKEE
jgi:hypothetical protein